MALIHELLRTDRVDLDYLVRYTNAHWLVVRNPGGADDGLFARDADGKPLAWDRARGAMDAAGRRRSAAPRRRVSRCPTAARRVPVFQLMAERYLSRRLRARRGRPSAAACRPRRIRRIAAEIADVAFEQTITHRPALDRRAGPPAREDDRPPGLHARDARHLGAFQRLPDLPRAPPAADAARRDRCAGRLPLQAALPAADPAGAGPGRQGRRSRTRRCRHILGFPHGPEDLLVDADGTPIAHRQGLLLGRAARRRTA